MDNKWKRFVSYLCYLTLLLIIIFLGLRYQAHLYSLSQSNYDYFPHALFKATFPLIIGLLLAVPHFLKCFAIIGKWKVDWIKLTVFGLPFLYLSVVPILYLSGVLNFNVPFSSYVMGGYFGVGASTTFETINGIIAGFIVSTSIIKIRYGSIADGKKARDPI